MLFSQSALWEDNSNYVVISKSYFTYAFFFFFNVVICGFFYDYIICKLPIIVF